MSKRVGVLFSGGLDSTYLVWKNLKDGNTVIPLYIEIENNRVKTIMEKNRIELLVKEFRKEFGNPNDYYSKEIENIRYVMSVGVHANEGSLYFKQMPIWIFAAVFIQGIDIDELQIGYVLNDDAISYLNDIQDIYKSYQAISEPMKPLVFPITKKRKDEIANELPKQYMDLIFSCEDARIVGSEDAEIIQYEPCCECVPCTHIMASEYYGTGNYPEIYKKNLLKRRAHTFYKEGYKIVDTNGKEFGWEEVELKAEQEPYQLYLEFRDDCDVECCEKVSE